VIRISNFDQIKRGAEATSRWAAVALGFSIPVSVALDGALAAVILLGFLLAARVAERIAAIRANPVALLALALFSLYLVGSVYSIGTGEDVVEFLSNAARLLFIPLLIGLFQDPAVRHRACWGFMAAMLLTLVLSCLLWLDLLPKLGFIKGSPSDPVIFKLHITQNLFMAFTALVCAVQARHALTRNQAVVWSGLALIASANVLFLVPGRTGHLVLLVLLVYLLFAWYRWKGLAVAGAVIGVVIALTYVLPSTALHQRAVLAYEEFSKWQPGKAQTTSVGQRLEFYRNTLEIIAQRPLLGAGTGGFRVAYEERVKGSGKVFTHNPHNEYLMVAAQLGLAGLALLLFLFWTQWRLALLLATVREQMLARGMVLAMVIASAVSSTLIDHAEGWFYVWMSALLFASIKSRQSPWGARTP
jgi:O-antigen ligase